MVAPLLWGDFLLVLISILLISFDVFAHDYQDIPKEEYLTFQAFLDTQELKKKSTIIANSNWIRLTYSSPLIGKYQIDDYTILSVSKFSGSIGDQLSNLNRWRSQLGLSALESSNGHIMSRILNGISTRIIQLNHNSQHMLIYWLTIDDQHFFLKVMSNQFLDHEFLVPFIELQSWNTI